MTLSPSAVAASAAPRTSQKCAGWFSQSPSIAGRASRTREQQERRDRQATQVPGRIHLKYPAAALSILSSAMKIVLPDSSELELPDGASGLEAARAIGPKLAEQAVLARVDGATRDLRLPLADGERSSSSRPATREDPDALFVLRHSTAHLLAEAVLRLTRV